MKQRARLNQITKRLKSRINTGEKKLLLTIPAALAEKYGIQSEIWG